jgi:hypothetical protein
MKSYSPLFIGGLVLHTKTQRQESNVIVPIVYISNNYFLIRNKIKDYLNGSQVSFGSEYDLSQVTIAYFYV